MKPITINLQQWNLILNDLRTAYKPSELLIREKMKRELGFVPRHGNYFVTESYRKIHLDFYDDEKKMLFLLTYSDILNEI